VGIAFKVDEDLPSAIQQELQNAGHDARTVADQGWSGRSDDAVWAGIKRERRLLVTADKGLADIRKLSAGRSWGVVLLRLERESWKGYVALIRSLLASTDVEQLAGAITIVTTKGIRMRRA
jgi:predicted nuclease of predicted toxin-antitoxin system